MKNLYRTVALCLFIGIFLSCEKDASKIFFIAQPSAKEIQAGDKFFFELTIHSRVGKLLKCTVSSFDTENGLQELPPIDLGVTDYEEKYYLQAPLEFVVDTLKVTYTFKVTSESGVSDFAESNVYVANAKGKQLEELTSLELSTSGNDALMTDLFQCVKRSESVKGDIVLTTSGTSNFWTSETDIMFVRMNSFDYPAATYSSVASAFRNSVKAYSVDNLTEGDIIVFGKVTKSTSDNGAIITPLGVAKIIASNRGYVRFNAKKLR